MILQALYEYYQRKSALNQIDPLGFITKEIDFVIIIDSEGNYIDFENHQIQIGKRLRGTPFRVPAIGKQAMKHDNSGNDANLLWDKSEFVIGVGNNGKNKLSSFLGIINDYYPNPPEDVEAILQFYKKELAKEFPFESIIKNEEIGELVKKGSSILTFKINNDRILVINKSHIDKAIKNKKHDNIKLGACLITGETNVPIENTHMVIKGIIGSQTSGANLISFNKPSFLSYHKEQSENAPVSKQAAEAYTKALQSLIDSEHNKIIVADATIIFWSERKATEINPEEIFPWIIAMQKSEKDDPDAGVNKIKKLFEAIYSGKLVTEKNNHFYVLGLAPNAARISVRFWKAPSVEDFGKNIKQHFEDFQIIRGPKDQEYLSLYQILSATALGYKMENVPPNLAGAVIESILDGTPYPQSLLQQCVRRIRAEQNVNRTRAAIIKAYLNRKIRFKQLNQKEITMSLDTNNTNVGYLLGRLFSVIERAQFVSNNYKEPSSGIRDRFFGAFSSSPISVLPILEKLYSHHYKKIKNEGKFREANRLEEWKKNIINKLEAVKIPPHLSMENQALFTIGYYHQKMEIENQKNIKSENELNNQPKESKNGNN